MMEAVDVILDKVVLLLYSSTIVSRACLPWSGFTTTVTISEFPYARWQYYTVFLSSVLSSPFWSLQFNIFTYQITYILKRRVRVYCSIHGKWEKFLDLIPVGLPSLFHELWSSFSLFPCIRFLLWHFQMISISTLVGMLSLVTFVKLQKPLPLESAHMPTIIEDFGREIFWFLYFLPKPARLYIHQKFHYSVRLDSSCHAYNYASRSLNKV